MVASPGRTASCMICSRDRHARASAARASESREAAELRALKRTSIRSSPMPSTCTSSCSSSAARPGPGAAALARDQRRHAQAACGGSAPAAAFRRHSAGAHRPAAARPPDRRHPAPLSARSRTPTISVVQALGRDMKLLTVVGDWYRSVAGHARRVPSAAAARAHRRRHERRRWSTRCSRWRCVRSCRAAPRCCSSATELAGWTHPHCALCGGEPDFARHHAGGRASPDLRALHPALEVRAADLPVLPQQRPRAHHVIRDAGRAVSRLRVRRVQAVSEGVRRPAGGTAGHADGRQVATLPLDAAAMQRGYSG